MKRGDILISLGRGDFSTKPRPGVVVQADAFTIHHPALTVCPITSHLTGDAFYRVPISPDETNGLSDESEVEIDLVQAIRRERIRRIVGQASEEVMFNVDQALRRWLAL